MKKLYLDDIRNPKEKGWTIVRSYNEFVDWIEANGMPDEISFDHDLSFEHYYGDIEPGSSAEYTGLDCAKWLADYCERNNAEFPAYNVHSANIVGAEAIESFIKSYKHAKSENNK